jgi:hypothetical protein
MRWLLGISLLGFPVAAAAEAPARPALDDIKVAHLLVSNGYRCEPPLDYKLLATGKDGLGMYRVRCRARDACWLYNDTPDHELMLIPCTSIHPKSAADKMLTDP